MICNVRCKINEYLPIVLVIMLTFLAGLGQTQTNTMIQSKLSFLHEAAVERQEQSLADLTTQIERYRVAFIERDYETMYHLSYFKNVPKPTLPEFRQIRNPIYDYKVTVRLLDVQMLHDKAVAKLELTIHHEVLGLSKTVHLQEWELVDGLWHRVDYAY